MNIPKTLVVGLVVTALVATAAPALSEEARPANDDVATAQFVDETPFAGTATTQGASLEIGEPQPTCGTITGSVWYLFTPAADMELIASASATSTTTLAVFSGTSFADLVEVACTEGVSLEAPFQAQAGTPYLLQVGSTGKRRSPVDVGLIENTWREETLHSVNQDVIVPEQKLNVLTIDGRPRAGDPSMYDISITTAAQTIQRGILTFGLAKDQIHTDAITVPRTATNLVMDISYRYDAGQYQCASDGGDGSSCTANSPIKDLEWLLTQGQDAELVIRIEFMVNGLTSGERTIVVPMAGQVLGIV